MLIHEAVMKDIFSTSISWWCHQMETFSTLLAICVGNSPLLVNSPHKGQWRGALMFSLICVWISGWVNSREAGALRCHRAHYGAIVMITPSMILAHWIPLKKKNQYRNKLSFDDVLWYSINSKLLWTLMMYCHKETRIFSNDPLTDWDQVTDICISKLTIIDSNLGNKFQWNLKWNSYIFIQENAFGNVVCEMAANLSRPQCVYKLSCHDTLHWYICMSLCSVAGVTKTLFVNIFIRDDLDFGEVKGMVLFWRSMI